MDATVLRVADRLIQTFPGHRTGRKAAWAAAKLHLAFRLVRSVPQVLALTAEKVNEKTVEFLRPKGEAALYLFDLGYWKYHLLDRIMDRKQHFLSRMRDGTHPLIKEVYVGCQDWVGKRLKEITLQGAEIDLRVNLTSASPHNPRMKYDVRLVGQPVAGVWHLYGISTGRCMASACWPNCMPCGGRSNFFSEISNVSCASRTSFGRCWKTNWWPLSPRCIAPPIAGNRLVWRKGSRTCCARKPHPIRLHRVVGFFPGNNPTTRAP